MKNWTEILRDRGVGVDEKVERIQSKLTIILFTTWVTAYFKARHFYQAARVNYNAITFTNVLHSLEITAFSH